MNGLGDAVLHRHVRGEGRAVVDVVRLPEGAVGAADVVVVAADDHRAPDRAVGDGLVEP